MKRALLLLLLFALPALAQLRQLEAKRQSIGSLHQSAAAPAAPFTPTNIPGGLSAAAWYEPSRSAMTTNAGVATLANLTSVGSTFNLTIAAATSPTTEPAKLNGFDCLFFDGTDDRLECAVLAAPQPWECFFVLSATNAGITGTFISSTVAGVHDQLDPVNGIRINAGSSIFAPVMASKYFVLGFYHNAASSLIVSNNVTVGSGNPGTSGFTTGTRVGARNNSTTFQKMSLACLIIFTNTTMSATDRSNVNYYCMTRFGPFP